MTREETKIYSIEWSNLHFISDDFALFSSRNKAKEYWQKRVEALKKDKSIVWENAELFLCVHTPCGSEDGIMKANVVASYSKEKNEHYKSEVLWEELSE